MGRNLKEDRLAPQAIDIEEFVLGSMILFPNTLEVGMHILPEDVFYREAHRVIFNGMRCMYKNGRPVDLLTLTQHLISTGEIEGIGGPSELTRVTSRVGAESNFEYHCRIITQKYLQRELIRIGTELVSECYDESSDVFDTINKLEAEISGLNRHIIGMDYEIDYSALVDKAADRILNHPRGLTGISTGNSKLDEVIGGWNQPDLIIIAGRPAMGKTTRALNFIKAACEQGKHVAMFSLEMSSEQIIRKQLSDLSGVYGNYFKTGNLTPSERDNLMLASRRLSGWNFYLNDKGAVSPAYVRKVCRERKKKYGCDLVVIDYIQLMSPNEHIKGRSREQEVSSISSALKSMAKELEVPVIALSQFSRRIEEQHNKRPHLWMLRESGALEQDADIVLGLYRPSVYNRYDKDPDYPGMTEQEYRRVSEIHVLKNRHGDADVYIEERFDGGLSRFSPYVQEVFEPSKNWWEND
jgi:replicative DNA helicase